MNPFAEQYQKEVIAEMDVQLGGPGRTQSIVAHARTTPGFDSAKMFEAWEGGDKAVFSSEVTRLSMLRAAIPEAPRPKVVTRGVELLQAHQGPPAPAFNSAYELRIAQAKAYDSHQGDEFSDPEYRARYLATKRDRPDIIRNPTA